MHQVKCQDTTFHPIAKTAIISTTERIAKNFILQNKFFMYNNLYNVNPFYFSVPLINKSSSVAVFN